jgi:hypothetical protein
MYQLLEKNKLAVHYTFYTLVKICFMKEYIWKFGNSANIILIPLLILTKRNEISSAWVPPRWRVYKYLC